MLDLTTVPTTASRLPRHRISFGVAFTGFAEEMGWANTAYRLSADFMLWGVDAIYPTFVSVNPVYGGQ